MSIHFGTSFTKAEKLQVLPRGQYRLTSKRVLDIAMVMIFAVPVLIVVAVLSLIISLDGASPFYVQERVGYGGRIFRMLKLRSMVKNADDILEDHLSKNPLARLEWRQLQKLRKDPRVTRVGRLIRKTSLDELPQLWNVLVGDMSIVGPRPIMKSQMGLYPSLNYYYMRPGLTGLWQISERNECSFIERADFDNRYFKSQSMLTDLLIMIATVGVIFKATGH